jgi:hypothetical protein
LTCCLDSTKLILLRKILPAYRDRIEFNRNGTVSELVSQILLETRDADLMVWGKDSGHDVEIDPLKIK